jgi:hypothetical protein
MYAVARLLQIVGLTIPLLAIVAQLDNRISLAQMLRFLIVAMAIFGIGYLMQRYWAIGSNRRLRPTRLRPPSAYNSHGELLA